MFYMFHALSFPTFKIWYKCKKIRYWKYIHYNLFFNWSIFYKCKSYSHTTKDYIKWHFFYITYHKDWNFKWNKWNAPVLDLVICHVDASMTMNSRKSILWTSKVSHEKYINMSVDFSIAFCSFGFCQYIFCRLRKHTVQWMYLMCISRVQPYLLFLSILVFCCV